MSDLRRLRRDLIRYQQENRALKTRIAQHEDWISTSHVPAAIRNLTQALTELHHLADPMPGQNPNRSRSAETPEPGAATRRYRNTEKRALTRIRQLTASIQAAVDGTPPAPRPKQCGVCGRAGRYGATHCDRDGTPLGGGTR